ncbi:hypothetical protein PT2222_60042 [Paraburkholderia tropica]
MAPEITASGATFVQNHKVNRSTGLPCRCSGETYSIELLSMVRTLLSFVVLVIMSPSLLPGYAAISVCGASRLDALLRLRGGQPARSRCARLTHHERIADRLVRGAQPDGFRRRIFERRRETAFASMTRKSETAERHERRHRAIRVDPHDARAHAFRHTMRAREIGGEYARSQTIGRAVGFLDRFLLGAERVDRKHRAEQFGRDAVRVGHAAAIENRRRVIEAAAIERLAAREHFRALLHGTFDHRFDVAQLTLGAQRSVFRRHVVGQTHANARDALDQPREKLVLHRRFDQQTRARHAALTARRENRRDLRIHRALNIAVGEHDKRRFTAEFERDLGEVVRGVRHNVLRGVRAAREGHFIDLRMTAEHRAAFRAEAGNDVHHARRKARFVHESREFEQGAGRFFRCFEHDGAARGERRAELHCGEKQLAIPRHDRGHHAHRLTFEPDLHVGLVDGNMAAFDLVGDTGVIAVILRDVRNLARRLANDLAGIVGFNFSESRRGLFDERREFMQQLAARRSRESRPCSVVERAARRVHGAVHFVAARFGHLRPHVARGRIHAAERRGAGFELAVDIQLKMNTHGITTSLERRHHVVDHPLERRLLALETHARIDPERVLVEAEFLVGLQARDDFLGRADHVVLAHRFRRVERMRGNFFRAQRLDHALADRALVLEPRAEVVVEHVDFVGGHLRVVFAARHVSVAQQHDLRARHLAEFFARGIEMADEFFDFVVAEMQRRDLHVATVGHGEFVAVRIARRDPDRRMRFLQRQRRRRGRREFPELALVRVIALPELLHGGNQFAHALTRVPGVEARHQTFIFERICAARNAQFETAVRDDVGHRGFACELDRVPERRDHSARAQAHVLRLAREIDEIEERIRRDREVHAVVLAGPDGVHAAAIRDLAQLDHFFVELLLARLVGDALHVNEKRKTHGVTFQERSGRTVPLLWSP